MGSLRTEGFDRQNEYLNARNTSRFRGLNCGRRSGKTNGEAIDHLEVMDMFPNSRNIYMALTAESAVDIAWDMFEEMDEIHKIGLKFQKSKYKIFHKNGSTLRFFGVDASKKQMDKLLGQKPRKISIDEAGSMTINMTRLVHQILAPALSDNSPYSWLTLLGTCETIPNTFFQSLTEGDEGADWAVFRWTAEENPYMRVKWQAEIDRIMKHNPKAVEAAWFKTHYLNQWVTDTDLMIIDTSNADFRKFDPQDYPGCVYGLGVDLGFVDASSFTLKAWSTKTGFSHFVKSIKEPGMDITDVAEMVKAEFKPKYKIAYYIIDGANKQGVEEIKNRHQIPFESAEKVGKPTYLRLLKDDIKTGKARIDPDGCEDLVKEWDSLVWKDKTRKEENPICENHCSDGALYIWRKARHYLWRPEEPEPNRDSEAYIKKQKQKEMERIKRMRDARSDENQYLY